MAEPKVSVLLDLVDRVTQPMNGIKSTISGAAKAIGAAFAAVAAGAFLKGAIEEAIEAERVLGRLKLAVDNAGGTFKTFGPAAEAAVKAVQRLSTASDDDLNDALTRMITVSGDTEGSLKNLQVAADLAAYSGKSLGDSADLVGKAMNGNTKGLKEFGISTTDSGVAMQQLREKVGGFAAQEANTFGGRLKQLKNGWDDFKESVGNAIIGNEQGREAIGRVTEAMANLAAWVDKNSGSIDAFLTGVMNFVAGVADLLMPILRTVIDHWLELRDTALGAWKAFDLAGPAIRRMIGVMVRGFGEMLQTIKPALKLIGMGDLPDEMAKNGQRMVSQAEADQKEITAIYAAQSEARVDATTTSAEKVVDAAKGGNRRRLQDDRETNELSKASIKELALAQKVTMEWAMTEFKAHYERLKVTNKAAADSAITHWTDYRVKVAEPLLDLEKELEDHNRMRVDKIRELTSQITGVARGLLDAAQAVGGLDAGLASALNSAINLGESIGKIASGDLLGGISQGIGAIANIGKSLFGKSEQEKKNEAALKANTAKLEEHRRKLGDLISLQLTGNQLSGVQGALEAFAAQTKGGKSLGKGWGDIIGRELLGRGVSVSDLDEVAKTLGIDIRPGGHLNSQAVLQLLEALKLVEPTQFGNTFSDQKARIEQGVSIGAIRDPLSEVLSLVTTGAIGSPAIRNALAGLDLSTAGGKAAGTGFLRNLFNNVGSLSAADLGGLTGSEFLDAISWLIDLLGQGQEIASAAGVDVSAPSGPVGTTVASGLSGGAMPVGATAAEHAERTAQMTTVIAQNTTEMVFLLERIATRAGGLTEEQLALNLQRAQADLGSAARAA